MYNAVKELAPSKANHQFGGWFKGDDALSESAVMPSENVTLKAKYKVAYTVELYLQDIEDETKYVKADNGKGSGVADIINRFYIFCRLS